MKAFYFANKTKTLRYEDNRKIVVGETHEVEGEIIPCENGLHASTRIIDALKYAPGSNLYLVELSGTVVETDDKVAASKRKYLAHYDADALLRAFARKQALITIEKIKPYCSEEDYKLIVNYLNTGDEELRSAARSAAYSAADSTSESAAWAAYSAVDAAVDSAAYAAADSAADSAAGLAASSADSAAAGLAASSADSAAAWAAESAAKSAPELAEKSAAWSAASSADSAAWAAYSAARSAEESARSARSARSAAESAANKMLTEMIVEATGWAVN